MIEGAEITPLNNVAGLSSPGPMLCYKGRKDSVPESISFKLHSIVLCATWKQKHPVLSILFQSWHLSLASPVCFGDCT